MTEKLLERWLDDANERVFQIPFCFALTKKGYTVVHLTRHTAMELGKDVLAIDPDGNPCAFQLKGTTNGRLNLTQWRNDVQPQINDLVLGAIVHPSINGNRPHRAILVVNGLLEEAVQRSIDDYNRGMKENGVNRKLEVMVRGDLFTMFKDVASEFWPTDAFNLKSYLELFMDSGRGQLPKEKLSHLIESLLPAVHSEAKEPTLREATLQILGASIIVALSLQSFAKKENHVAQIEAWTLCASYVMLVAERWNLNENCWKPTVDLIIITIYDLLEKLAEELSAVKHLIVDSPMTDFATYRHRITHLVGLMSLYGLWRKELGVPDSRDQFIKTFCTDNANKILLWGEYAAPQFLAFYLYLRTVDATMRPDVLLRSLIEVVVRSNVPRDKSNSGLPNPYYSVEDILPHQFRLATKPLNDSFVGSSYCLESFFHLYLRLNWKNETKLLWPDITRLAVMRFSPHHLWEFYRWRCLEGEHVAELVAPTQKWDNLRQLAAESSGAEIPSLVKQYPMFYLSLLMTMPHRLNASGARWIATILKP